MYKSCFFQSFGQLVPFTLIHHVYLVLVHPVHFIDIALVLVHLVHLVSGSGDGGGHEHSQNIWFELLKFVHLVLGLVFVLVLVLVLVSVGVR